ncbi:MAG: NfeD family protein, partial [Pseudomonadales bacterium]|nr:NfeD family protein [Pseudomonadales bacterium]
METLFLHITYWHWFALGALLLILEIFGIGGYFLWIGLSAGVVGLMLLVEPGVIWQWQLLLFGLLSIVITYLWWRYQKSNPEEVEEPLLNQRGARY